MRAVAETVANRVQDKVAFDFGDRTADLNRCVLIGACLLRRGCRRGGANEVGYLNCVDVNRWSPGEKNGAMHGILKFADVSRPLMLPQ